MLAVPAKLAGCKTIVLATPPRPDGTISPEVRGCPRLVRLLQGLGHTRGRPALSRPTQVLYCAKKAGVTHVLKAGGAQAISAMAWGTKSCPKARLRLAAPWLPALLPDARC